VAKLGLLLLDQELSESIIAQSSSSLMSGVSLDEKTSDISKSTALPLTPQQQQSLDPKFRLHIKECQESLDIAVNILNDLLCYEKLESGVFELEKELSPTLAFLEKSLELFSIQAKQKGIDLIFRNDLPPTQSENMMINIDPKKMSQVTDSFCSVCGYLSCPSFSLLTSLPLLTCLSFRSFGTLFLTP
jgi:signal transduction histidine kinase